METEGAVGVGGPVAGDRELARLRARVVRVLLEDEQPVAGLRTWQIHARVPGQWHGLLATALREMAEDGTLIATPVIYNGCRGTVWALENPLSHSAVLPPQRRDRLGRWASGWVEQTEPRSTEE